ncbi:hypothetical protein AGMMS50284_0710 [Clostridia bacterium]|nr:hypothetical protein AGMMS50284_0710 [Clostridia bacterium]
MENRPQRQPVSQVNRLYIAMAVDKGQGAKQLINPVRTATTTVEGGGGGGGILLF